MRHFVLAFLVLATFSLSAQNQSINEELIPEGRMDQHKEFMADQSPYPAKPRNQWAVGINVGIANVSGDVGTRPFGGAGFGWGAGVNVRKALGYATSLRLGYNYLNAYGQNSDRQAVGRNSTLTDLGYDNPSLINLGDPYNSFVHNYEHQAHNVTMDLLLNLNNLKFHSGSNKIAFFLAGGGGLYMYRVNYDALDAGGNIYDWSSIVDNVSFEDSGLK
ncbi:MAG: OOP family OmpA-OmpF porin, partial [Limisphaerales bacterium]